jgi:hypothetical protein
VLDNKMNFQFAFITRVQESMSGSGALPVPTQKRPLAERESKSRTTLLREYYMSMWKCTHAGRFGNAGNLAIGERRTQLFSKTRTSVVAGRKARA